MQIGGTYIIDFARISEIPKFYTKIKTGDRRRTIKLILLKNNEVLNLNDYTVTVAAKKSDGSDIFNNVNIVNAPNGQCEVEITEQMLAANLDLPCEIIVYDEGGVVASSSNFVISIIDSLKDEESIVSSSEFTALTLALSKVQNFDNRINSKRDKSAKITRNDLDTSSNNSKIGLNNLADEVHQAMAGNSPVNPTIPDGSLTVEKYANNSVTIDKMTNKTVHSIIYNDEKGIDFTFDDNNKQLVLTIGKYTFLLASTRYESLNESSSDKIVTIPYPENYIGVNSLWFKPSSKEFILANYRDYNKLGLNTSVEAYLIATVSITNKKINILSDFSINGNNFKNINLYGDGYFKFTFDFKRKVIVLEVPRNAFACNGIEYISLGNSRITEMSFPITHEGINYFVFDRYTNSFSICNYKGINKIKNKNNILILGNIAIFDEGYVNVNGNYIVNGGIRYDDIFLAFNDTIKIDKVNNKLLIPNFYVKSRYSLQGNRYITPAKCNSSSNYFEFDIPTRYEFGTIYLDFEKLKNFNDSLSNNECPLILTKSGVLPNFNSKNIIIATMIYGQVTTIYPWELKQTLGNQIDTSFNLNDNRLILPNKMFFVKNEELPIYLSSIIPDDCKTLAVKPSVIYTHDQTKKIETFLDSYYLNADKISNTFKIGYRQYEDNKLYYKEINKIYCDPTTIKNTNPQLLLIGDSITNRYIALRSELFLKKWGITPQFVGTFENYGGKKGEGREGWSYPNFTGKGNVWGNDGSVITPQPSGSTSTLKQNPFLKIATDEDKEKYPEWCFRNTGAKRELSYANDDNKTGIFYIFDMKHYLTAHNIPTPDIITIALSTNDINRDEDALEMCKFNMQLMISRIRQQLPTVKIGIIPSPSWGIGNDNFKSKATHWIEECINIIDVMSDDNVFVVPIWCHMNKEWGFPIGNVSDISKNNSSKVGVLSDTIHPSEIGQEQYGKALATFIANMI
ncbi:BppU family phage baseplate upper protein [Clostridium perfringens]|nr:BppU family phage baseplate upper protein [Clostridium perfringens]